MIPHSRITIRHGDPASMAGLPSRDEAMSDYLDGNREYEPGMMASTWDDAAEALEVEQNRLVLSSTVTNDNQVETELDGDLDDWEAIALGGLDVGVAAAVMALNAAGCVTSTSCRGHPAVAGDGRGYPRIRFFADPSRASIVLEAALASGCGMEVDGEGVGLLYAPSIAETIAFAAEIIGRRDLFRDLPPRRFG